MPVVEGEDEAPALGVVDERGYAQAARVPRSWRAARRTKRPQQIGERSAAGAAGGSALASRACAAAASGSRDGIAPGRDSPPGLGVEPPADRFGGAGELGRQRRQLGLVDQLLVVARARLDVRLAASQLGEPLPLAVLRGEVGQSLDGRGIGRLEAR